KALDMDHKSKAQAEPSIQEILASLGSKVEAASTEGQTDPDTRTTPDSNAGETKKKSTKFALIRADDLEFKEPEYIITGLMEAETLALLFADPGCGKSFIALDMAASI